jgi:thiamine pyrophosphokinase
MKKLAVCVEGGGNTAQEKTDLRKGFEALFKEQRQIISHKGGRLDKLEKATTKTTKGKYAKIKNASKLLALLETTKVRKRYPRFLTFIEWLDDQIAKV